MRDFQTLTGLPSRPPMTIGVMGAPGGVHASAGMGRCYELGRAIARRGFVLVSEAGPGLPLHAARGAKDEGGMTIGLSPGLTFEEHLETYGVPTEWLDVIIYTGSGLMGRGVTALRSCDIVICVGERSGAMGELAIAYEEGKLIGVLDGPGGLTTASPDPFGISRKDSGAPLLHDSDPDRLIEKLWSYYCQEHFRGPSAVKRKHATSPEGLAS